MVSKQPSFKHVGLAENLTQVNLRELQVPPDEMSSRPCSVSVKDAKTQNWGRGLLLILHLARRLVLGLVPHEKTGSAAHSQAA